MSPRASRTSPPPAVDEHTPSAPPTIPFLRRMVLWAFQLANALIPKRRDSAVLAGVPPLNDALVVMVAALRQRGVRCFLYVEPGIDSALEARAQAAGVERVYVRRSVGAIWRYARSRYVFFTHGLYRVPPSRRQVVVNLWHGEFTKEIGAWVGTLKVPSSYAVATSKLGVAYRSAEFELPPPQVLIVGNPRNDLLMSTSKSEGRRQLDLPEDRRILLWLPTYRFRHLKMGPPATPSRSDLEAFDDWLDGRQTLLVVKHHPLAGNLDERPDLRNVRFMTDSPECPVSIAALMASSDGLITDFSSAWVDYLLLDRPIWIHWPDHHRWSEHGRLPLDPLDAWLPGPLTTEISQLLAEVESEGTEGGWPQRRIWLRSVLHRHQDSRSAERLLDALGVEDPPDG